MPDKTSPVSRGLKLLIGSCAVVLFAAAGVFGTQSLLAVRDTSEASGDAGAQPIRVGVTSPQVRDLDDAVSAVGTLRPIRSVELVPSTPGRVVECPCPPDRRSPRATC